jgi:WD40 repeat protein
MLAFKPHKGAIFQLAFSPDGASVATSGKAPMLCVSDAGTGTARWSHTHPRKTAIGLGVAYSPDGSKLATADWQSVYVFDADTGKLLHAFPGRGYAVTFTPDSKSVVASERRPGAYIHRTALANGDANNFRGGDMFDHCNRFRFSPDGKLFAVHGDTEVSVADAKTATIRNYFPLSNAPSGVGALAFSPCGRFLAYSDGPKLFLHDWAENAVVGPRTRSSKHIQEAAFTPDGKHLITVSNDETAVVWETGGWTEVRSFAWEIGKLKSVAVWDLDL